MFRSSSPDTPPKNCASAATSVSRHKRLHIHCFCLFFFEVLPLIVDTDHPQARPPSQVVSSTALFSPVFSIFFRSSVQGRTSDEGEAGSEGRGKGNGVERSSGGQKVVAAVIFVHCFPLGIGNAQMEYSKLSKTYKLFDVTVCIRALGGGVLGRSGEGVPLRIQRQYQQQQLDSTRSRQKEQTARASGHMIDRPRASN